MRHRNAVTAKRSSDENDDNFLHLDGSETSYSEAAVKTGDTGRQPNVK